MDPPSGEIFMEVIGPGRQPEPETRRERREKEEFARALIDATPTVWVTRSLVVIDVAVFALMVLLGVSLMDPSTEDLLRFGADHGPLTVSGEWWRVLTCAFVHIGLVHLLLNMWCLWQGGQLAERFYGHGAYLALYLASAVGGSLTSLAWNPSIVSAGASGAIFGVYGGLLAVVVLHRRVIPAAIFEDLKKSTVAFVGYNVLYGFAMPGIDNAAHLGGLATGFLAGVSLRRGLPGPASSGGEAASAAPVSAARTSFARFAPVVIALALGAFGAKHRVEAAPSVQAERHFDLALAAWQEEDTERALAEVEAALALDPGDPRSWTLRGELVWIRGDRSGAVECYERAIALASDYAYPHVRLGWARQDSGDLAGAREEFTRAIYIDPEDADAYHARGWVLAQLGRPAEAVDDYDRALRRDDTLEDADLHRAYALRDLRRDSEALAVFQERAGRNDGPALRAALVAWTIRARLGEREAASSELRERLAGRAASQPDAWFGAFLLGDLGQAELLDKIRERDLRSPNGQLVELCEAWYFVGAKALLDGDEAHASTTFRYAAQTRAIDTPLFASAVVELAALQR